MLDISEIEDLQIGVKLCLPGPLAKEVCDALGAMHQAHITIRDTCGPGCLFEEPSPVVERLGEEIDNTIRSWASVVRRVMKWKADNIITSWPF
jgi:hypothetical protein